MTPPIRISIVTPALPGRSYMLSEACKSVRAQVLQPAEHLIGIDHERKGSARMRNQLAAAAAAEWVAFLDDDDVLYPQHLAVLAQHCQEADIIYSWCHVEGRDWTPNRRFDADRLREGNFIPATVLMRASLFRELKGFRGSSEVPHGWEDWDLWLRALDLGARFRCEAVCTWLYRFHGGNKTYCGEREAA